jgi:hypothetical protein
VDIKGVQERHNVQLLRLRHREEFKKRKRKCEEKEKEEGKIERGGENKRIGIKENAKRKDK